MKANNKKRILALIDILKKYSDMNHKLSLSEIVTKLEEQDIMINDRKTIYDDFKALNDYGYEVEYENGYYLTESPFSISEIKIITDSLNSLNNLDDNLLSRIKDKMYSFISIYEENQLRKLEYNTSHSDKKFINKLEDVLDAIGKNKTIIIQRRNKTQEEICPIFLNRKNDYYYLYYHYLNNDKIYHTRFDNILSTKLTDNDIDFEIPKNKIIETINASSNSFYSNKAETIKIILIDKSEYTKSRLENDFPNIVFTNEGFSIKASVNEALFTKFVAYGDKIKISDYKIADQYINYLNTIVIRNKAKD